jgi:uncharacterized repeat protein (TIGR02543 family)
VINVNLKIKHKFNIQRLNSKCNSLLFISLLFTALLITSPLSTTFNKFPAFAAGAPDVSVDTETTLQEAITNAEESITIAIVKDIILSTAINIPAGKDITLVSEKTEGFWKLIGANNHDTITIEDNGVLTLNSIIVTHKQGETGHGIVINTDGTLNLYGGEISDNYYTDLYGGGVLTHGTFNMYGGTIYNNIAKWYGGGVYNTGTFKMYDGEITNNKLTVNNNGGGVNNGGDFDMFGGMITGNTGYQGGGVYNWGNFAMFDGEISKNKGGSTGGGVHNHDGKSSFTMHNGIIAHNTVDGSGGGVSNFGSFTMHNGIIASNTAQSGGGVYIHWLSSGFTMYNGAITGNTATASNTGGGGVNNDDSVFTMYDGEITNNRAINGGGGGGVHNFHGTFTMFNGVIAHNTAANGGGVHNYYSGKFNMFNGVIAHNTATYGGGIANYQNSLFELSGESKITNNNAYYGGGVFNYYNSVFDMIGGVIAHNTATYGGGVSNYYSIFEMSGEGVIANNTATNSGGGVEVVASDFKMFSGEVSGNTATNNGGGVWVTDTNTNLDRVFIGEQAVFSNNQAIAAYNRHPTDDAKYTQQVKGTSWTVPFTQGYNNYDISYVSGNPLAVWTLTFDTMGGEPTPPPQTILTGNKAEKPSVEPQKTGYTFVGWFTQPEDGTTWDFNTPITKNTILYAQWTTKTLTINFDANTGTGTMPSITTTYSTTITLPSNTYTKANYQFIAWNTKPDGTGTTYLDQSTFIYSTDEGDLTLYAQWVLPTKVYHITYDLRGGINAPGNPIVYTIDNLPLRLAVPTREGYTFLNWDIIYTNHTMGILPTSGIPKGTTGDVILVAIWHSNNMYNINYDLNGGVNAPGNPVSYKPTDNFPIAIIDPAKIGYEFLGWTVKYHDGSQPDITTPTTNYNIPKGTTGGITLIAHWQPLQYNIIYNLEGGTNVAGNPLLYTKESAFPITIINPVRAGYEFTGWNVTYANGTTAMMQINYNIIAGTTGDIVLTANWKTTNTDGNTGGGGSSGGSSGGSGGGLGVWFVVRFVDWDGTLLKSERVHSGGSATAPISPIREGYTFTNWDTLFTNVKTDLIVTAQYIQEPEIVPPIKEEPSTWALANLLLSVAGVIFAIIATAWVLLQQKKQENQQQYSKPQNAAAIQYSKQEKQQKHRSIWLITALALSIAGIIVFLLTEDMSRKMVMIDKWTIVNAVIFIIEIIAILYIYKHNKKDKNQQPQTQH